MFDYLEGQSRRNNLLVHGIHGTTNEQWSVTENKVRDFIKVNLESAEI